MPIEIGQRFLRVGKSRLELGRRSHFMGIVNATPDSFSDGGRYLSEEAAAARAIALLEEGAWCVDVGGESTRPGYTPVSEQEEIRRVVPVIEHVMASRSAAVVSVDTTKPAVARASVAAGARMVNDIWGLQREPELAEVAAESGAVVALMRNGRGSTAEGSILDRVRASWDVSVAIALRAGISEAAILLDPGLGFGTSRQEEIEILRGLEVLGRCGFPLLLGASRKRLTATPLGFPLEERIEPSLATTATGIAAGIDFFRVHEVAPHARLAALADLIYRGGEWNE